MSDEEPLYDTPEQRREYEANLPACSTCGAPRTVEWVYAQGFGGGRYVPGLEYCSDRDCSTRWS